MNVMYIDESGKNLFSDGNNKGLYVYGGIILNKDKVYECLNRFKFIYQKHRREIHLLLREQIIEDDPMTKSEKVRVLMANYEIHAYYMFNKAEPNKNPWFYYGGREKHLLIKELIDSVMELIDAVYYFQADKETLSLYYDEIKLTGDNDKQTNKLRDKTTEKELLELMIKEFHDWLEKRQRKGLIIPDVLDEKLRESFVSKMYEYKSYRCWDEPILVDSGSNAFTQLADLVTYIYMKINTSHLKSNKSFRKLYKQKIQEKAVICDLTNYLKNREG